MAGVLLERISPAGRVIVANIIYEQRANTDCGVVVSTGAVFQRAQADGRVKVASGIAR